MQVPKSLDRALKSKNVLYAVLVVSILNVLNYLMNHQYESTIFFCAVGFLVAYFNKNMTVVMAAAIVGTLLFRQSQYISREGMEQNDNDVSDTKTNQDPSGQHHNNHSDNKKPDCASESTENACNDLEGCAWDNNKDPKCFASPVKEEFTTKKNDNNSNAELAEAERLMTRLENMMNKAESFGGMFGGKK